jgi:restriction system protein
VTRGDIIAKKDHVRIVAQCKFYTTPVGNKAVQEVVAARIHEGADRGVAVTNSSFTRSANQLASTTGTILIQHEEIPDLMEKISS